MLPDNLEIFNFVNTPYLVCSSQGRVVFFNIAFEELIGFELVELFNKEIYDFFDDEGSERFRKLLLQNYSNGFFEESDLIIHKKSGRKINVDLSVKSQGGENRYYHFTVLDKTGLKKIEEEKSEILRLASHQSKMSDLGELAAGIAHELNNPLAIVQGYAEVVTDTIENQDPQSKLLKSMSKIVGGCKRMTSIIESMRKFSRSDNQNFGELSLRDVVEGTLLLIQHSAESSQISVKQNLHDLKIFGNQSQVQQILINIFGNAIHALESVDFSDEREKCIEIELYQIPPSYVGLKISNNGPEISPDKINKIFNPFYTTKEVGKGTGLGLSLSYDFMRCHRGRIEVQSKSGITSFEMVFPDIKQYQLNDVATKILVVDDESEIRKILCEYLSLKGYFVQEAKDGIDGLNMIQSSRFDFVVTDMKMPRMDGLKFINKVREVASNTILIGMSAYGKSNDPETEARRVSADYFLEKPIDLENMLQFIQKIEEKMKVA